MENLFSQSFIYSLIGMIAHPLAPQVYKKHDAHSCLKPEVLPKNTALAISISPNDKQQFYGVRNRVSHFRQQLYGRLLIHVAPYASYDLYVEISEAGRLHCHGTITVKDVLGFYTYAIPFMRTEMTYEIDTIGEPAKWDAYCTKQADLFEDGHNPRIKSLKDPLFILNTKKGKVVTEVKQYTFDDFDDDTNNLSD